jgi:hypothetical protein
MTAAQWALLEQMENAGNRGLTLGHPGMADAAALDGYERAVQDLFAVAAAGYATRPKTAPNAMYPRGKYAAAHAAITHAGRAALARMHGSAPS